MQRFIFLGILRVCLCAAVSGARAQVLRPVDDAARLRERFTAPPAPQAQPAAPSIKLQSTIAPEQAGKLHFTIKKIVIEGSTVYTAGELDALAAELVGRSVSLQAVYDLAAKITTASSAAGLSSLLAAITSPPRSNNKSDMKYKQIIYITVLYRIKNIIDSNVITK